MMRPEPFIFALGLLIGIAGASPDLATGLDLSGFLHNGTYRLPQELNEENTTIEYSVDAGIHHVTGRVTKLSGRVWAEAGDDTKIRARISFSPLDMNSGNESRDARMRSVMDFQQFREITLSVTHSQLPNSRQLEFGQSLAGALEGTLTIRGITRHVAVPIKIKRMASGVLIKGDTHISWTDYGIADPSTLIATVKDRVEIRYEVRLNR